MSRGPTGAVESGVKVFCSGAGGLDRALVLVRGEEPGPAAAGLRGPLAEGVEVDLAWYRGAGMRASESHRVVFSTARGCSPCSASRESSRASRGSAATRSARRPPGRARPTPRWRRRSRRSPGATKRRRWWRWPRAGRRRPGHDRRLVRAGRRRDRGRRPRSRSRGVDPSPCAAPDVAQACRAMLDEAEARCGSRPLRRRRRRSTAPGGTSGSSCFSTGWTRWWPAWATALDERPEAPRAGSERDYFEDLYAADARSRGASTTSAYERDKYDAHPGRPRGPPVRPRPRGRAARSAC